MDGGSVIFNLNSQSDCIEKHLKHRSPSLGVPVRAVLDTLGPSTLLMTDTWWIVSPSPVGDKCMGQCVGGC